MTLETYKWESVGTGRIETEQAAKIIPLGRKDGISGCKVQRRREDDKEFNGLPR